MDYFSLVERGVLEKRKKKKSIGKTFSFSGVSDLITVTSPNSSGIVLDVSSVYSVTPVSPVLCLLRQHIAVGMEGVSHVYM